MPHSPQSNCCHAPMKVNTADEGTSCYMCSKCDKSCDVENGIMPTNTSELEERFEDFLEEIGFENEKNSSFYAHGIKSFIAAEINSAIERTVRETLDSLVPIKTTGVGADFLLGVIRETIKNYAQSKGIIISDKEEENEK